MKLSMIVPVYNTEPYLRQCLDSLVNQTFRDFEVLVINDGSPDGSQLILDEYQAKYPYIRVIEKENGGLSDARNVGIQLAQGDYLGFLDSDDYVLSEMFEKMVKKAESEDFDLVCCDLDFVYEDGHKMRVSCNIDHDLKDPDEIRKSLTDIYPTAWNKIYHKRLFTHDVFFTKQIWYEDMEFIHRLYPYIQSIGVVHEPFNQYVQHQGAITSTFNAKLFDYLKNWEKILADYQALGLLEKYHDELEYSCVRYLYATFVKRAANYPDVKLFERAVSEAQAFVQEHFPHYRRNRYFYQHGAKGLYLVVFQKALAKLVYRQVQKK